MGHKEIEAELETELAEVAASAGCQLLECEFVGGVLRLTLDRPGGVTLDDCQTVSKQVSALLDVADFGPGKYVLEVSSPGLDRKLYGPRDYERFAGRQVRITWRDPETGRKQTVVGDLTGLLPEDGAEVALVDSATGEEIRILLKYIELARLEPEL
jgi:ribosome maturation factor RimP